MDTLGIDLAKLTFDVTLLTTTKAQHHHQFPNTPAGFEALQGWLTSQGVKQLHACMEATNVYWEALAQFLYEEEHTVSVVNPARIKGFAMSQLLRNKTDKLDSLTIATFCVQTHPTEWTPPTEVQRKLRALVRHREALLKTRIQQHNRLSDASDEDVRTSLQLLLDTLTAEISKVEQQLKAHLAEHPELRTNATLLQSIVGFGLLTVQKLLAEFPDLQEYKSGNAVAADAGLNPAHYQSGSSVRRRPQLSKVGKASVRAALYWPAITAMTHCPAMKQFAARLAARGKPKGVIIGAVMRKLLHIAYGVLKHQTPYDPTKVLGSTAPPT
jgi:transposase